MIITIGRTGTARGRTWEVENGEGRYVDHAIASLLDHLGDPVEIEENTTFGDVLRRIIIDAQSDILDRVFYSETQIKNALRKLDRVLSMSSEPSNPPFDVITLSPPDVDVTMWYRGDIVEADTLWILDGESGEDKHCPVEFTPVCGLKNVPFRLDLGEKVLRYDRFAEERWQTVVDYNRICTVYDLYRGILNEITFCGIVQPGDRTPLDDAKDEMRTIHAEITVTPKPKEESE